MRRSAHEIATLPALPRDPILAGLTLDSRKVRPGYLFAALPGSHHDGAAFVADAVDRGAVAILAAPDARLPDDLAGPPIRTIERELMQIDIRMVGRSRHGGSDFGCS